MLDPKRFPFCSEFYIVERVVEVVAEVNGEQRQIRIEALHGPNSTTKYSTNAYIKEDVLLQPDVTENGKLVSKQVRASIWVPYNLPWTNRDSADAAIEQALQFLGNGV